MFFDRGAEASPRVTEAVLLATLVLTACAVAVFRIRTVASEVDPRFAGTFLWTFLALFLLRVLGQVVVVLSHTGCRGCAEHDRNVRAHHDETPCASSRAYTRKALAIAHG